MGDAMGRPPNTALETDQIDRFAVDLVAQLIRTEQGRQVLVYQIDFALSLALCQFDAMVYRCQLSAASLGLQ